MSIKSFIKKYIPLFSVILFSLAIVCALINIISIVSIAFSDFFTQNIASVFRLIFAKLTSWLPFSFAELMIMALPLIIFFVLFFMFCSAKKGKTALIRYIVGFMSVLTLFYSTFVLTFATAYRGESLESRLELDREKVSAEELRATLDIVIRNLNAFSEKAEYGEDNFSKMPYSFSELNEKMNEAYKNGCKKYGFIQNMKSRVKPVILSEPMTYTHISGVYTYFTGEANVNVNYPDFNIPYTMAHEMSHQRGIAREDEANFVAYLICIESDDDYIKYSAYLNMFEYLSNALYKADKEIYREMIKTVSLDVRKELVAYSDFFDKYRDNPAADISDAVNNSFLISQGQSNGTQSYGLVVDLCVAYYKAMP